MLRLRLRYEHPDRVVALHQRAARWYERNNMPTDAVRHAIAAGDWPLAAAVVVAALDAADGLMKSVPAGEEATSRLTAAVLRLSVCLRTGDLATAATAARRAE